MRRRLSCGVIVGMILALLVMLVLGVWVGLKWANRRALGPLAGGGGASATTTTPSRPGEGMIRATFTDADLTQQLRQSMHGEGDNLSVHLEPNLVVVTGKVNKFLGQEVRAELTPFVEGGRVSLKMKRATVGPVKVPLEVAQMLSNQAARALTREQEKIPGLMVDSIVVTQGEMEVSGHLDKSTVPPPLPPAR
jgi:hypothetical protein